MKSRWLDYQRYAVWGMARSGKAAANLLARRGKEVVLSDICSVEEVNKRSEGLDPRVQTVAEENRIGDAEVIVTSPGLAPGLPVFAEARRRSIPVISEVELAFAAGSNPWLGITGTDGKTTTASLTGAMLAAGGVNAVVAGNIGTALCEVVEEAPDDAVIVAELSANQLWSCHSLAIRAAAITNMAPDHLDYFPSTSDYYAAKLRLVEMQKHSGDTILPLANRELYNSLGTDGGGERTYFGSSHDLSEELSNVVYFDDQGRGLERVNGQERVWLEDFSKTHLIGPHNQLNASCAAALARTLDVSWEAIEAGLMSFRPLAHRMEPVETIDGVRFIDDSKATNPHASLAGLRGISEPLIVIAGGLDKGLPLNQWVDEVAQRAEVVILIGSITDKLADLLVEQGAVVVGAGSLKHAVEVAKKRARPGSTVVLSPACSSYDMFSSYKERGQVFKDAVRALKGADHADQP